MSNIREEKQKHPMRIKIGSIAIREEFANHCATVYMKCIFNEKLSSQSWWQRVHNTYSVMAKSQTQLS